MITRSRSIEVPVRHALCAALCRSSTSLDYARPECWRDLYLQAVLLRELLQRHLRPRADVLDDFCRGQRAEPAGILVTDTARKAKQKAGREQIAGARGIDDPLDRESRYRDHAFLRC